MLRTIVQRSISLRKFQRAISSTIPHRSHDYVVPNTANSEYTHFLLKPKIHTIASEELEARAGEAHPYWDNPDKVSIYLPADLVVQETHLTPKTKRDRLALASLWVVKKILNSWSKYRGPGGAMTRDNWLDRVAFLETVAGCHGMVASMARHLRSLRTMTRDYGWISSLLEESENERMHLLIVLQMKNPSLFYRLRVAFVQAVYFNVYFICYYISPITAHRYVGYYQEETISTYTKLLADLQSVSSFQEWAKGAASPIAKEYYKLKDGATNYDVIECIRADEANHRDVNHEFASDPITDPESLFP